MDTLLGKLTFEKLQAKIDAVRLAKAESTDKKAWEELLNKQTTYFKALEFEKAVDIGIELVATASKGDTEDDKFAEAVAKYNLASNLHRVRACRLECQRTV